MGEAGLTRDLITKSTRKPNHGKLAFMGKINETINWLRAKTFLSNKLSSPWLTLLSGQIFGTSVSVGLGLDILPSLVIGFTVSLSVLLSGSLVSYLVIQTIVLSAGAALFLLMFRLDNTWSVTSETFQIGYLFVVLMSPFVALAPKVRKATNSFGVTKFLELLTSILFASAIGFLRSRMPSDAAYALGQMYYGEDNAGITTNTVTSLDLGFASPHAQQFGEFVTGSYLAAAGLISNFGGESNHALLAILTHYNMTLLFMGWIPLVGLAALSFSGKKFGTANSLIIIAFMSGALALLFWPFT
jgi:hypothetical protein